MTTYKNANVAFPLIGTDKIIYAETYSFSVANTIGATATITVDKYDVFLSGVCPLPFGIYTFDGGATWNDATNTSINSGPNTSVTVTIRTAGASVKINYKVYATVGGGSTIPIQLSYGLIVDETESPLGDNSTYLWSNQGNNFSQKAAYDSRKPAPRVALAGVSPYDGTARNIPLPNDITSIPDVRVFEVDNSTLTVSIPTFTDTALNTGIRIDSSNLTLSTPVSANEYLIYIIYYPE